MNAWVELTAPELAYLADADPVGSNVLDRVAVAGQWLREARIREEGERLFGRRLEALPEVPLAGWAAVTAAAREFGRAHRGSSLIVHGQQDDLVLVLTPTAHIVVRPYGLGIRLMEGLPLAEDIANEIRLAGEHVRGMSIRWVGGEEVESLAWLEDGSLVGPEQAPRSSNDPLVELCAFALSALDAPAV